MPFSLPRLVGFCLIGKCAIFLDARADRYWMLPDHLSQALVRHCAGIASVVEVKELFEQLEKIGLIENGMGQPIAPCAMHLSETSYLDSDDCATWSSTIMAWFRFATTERRLRRFGLEAGLDRLERSRQRSTRTGTRDIERHAAAFARLRLLVSPIGRCLPLSLALATRCASVDARLVFGVKLNPFAAHAWVQRDGDVLNDEVHVVRQFTPVLAV